MNAPLHRPPLLARINWYWTFQLAGWGALTLFNSVYGGSTQLRIVVTIASWGSLGGLLLSHLWHGVLRRRGWAANGLRWQRIVPSLIVLAAIQTASVTAAFHVMYPPDTIRGIAWLPGALLFWFGVFLTWTVFYFTALSLRRASRFEAEALRLEVLAKDAQLRALQAQVNPHFFFNSLNSVRALIFEDREAAARMIDQLANLMRHALQSSQHATVPLAAELEAVRAYLAIEQSRFEERLRVSFDIAPGLELVRVPPMALQTLVENAVKYGVEASAEGGDIRIAARRGAGMDTLQIEVANTGRLRSASGSTGIGLHNARQRLQLACGERASLELCEQAGWVYATIHLPELA
ncbi:sensor histidine kinase [Janthinobacterium lividum]|uniref:sensor histidine kinase n=1 Tax=Janthinobacterium lividum TaxID=29581 RepID=UPI000874E769|nr:histidine kinase [Janthinobacterium lividum]MCC7714327.1 histidine kinase [Janthinobacterium lividum]OEZ66103.1 sensor histidine kinase YehU [Janthinobacterium lividum]WQE30471.1 histidine kinase [Janthinobacterium lividum]STQ95965.1 Probable sensor-like histidine kinase YehU [Janthinobacterium lividum]